MPPVGRSSAFIILMEVLEPSEPLEVLNLAAFIILMAVLEPLAVFQIRPLAVLELSAFIILMEVLRIHPDDAAIGAVGRLGDNAR